MRFLPLLFIAIGTILGATSCEERTSGVCYCEFFNGSDQEYDLTHLSRSNQMDTCYVHNTNAANFGGSCELE